jgi:hypothetical protein
VREAEEVESFRAALSATGAALDCIASEFQYPGFRADSDEAGHAFQYEAGHLFRSEAGQRSDLMSATGVALAQID